MRRALPLILAAAILLAVLAAPAGAADLKTGARGPRVAAIQKWLGLTPDRIFGKQTRVAVKRWQRAHGLRGDGVVGPATWSAFKRRYSSAAKARRVSSARRASRPRVTSTGSRVQSLQKALGISADGVFGPGTKKAVKTFQKRHGLTADGVVGPATWSALGHGGVSVVLKPKRSARTRVHVAAGSNGVPYTVRRIIAAGNRIAHLPYKWGGGHGQWNDSGYDCSGSVSYALHGGGILDAPLTSSGFMAWGSSGPGRWITIYASPGHVYMVVNGRRFDTTGRDESGSRWQWAQRSSAGYVVRHPTGY
jgi:cell wall-associated NlpC family hydrolase